MQEMIVIQEILEEMMRATLLAADYQEHNHHKAGHCQAPFCNDKIHYIIKRIFIGVFL